MTKLFSRSVNRLASAAEDKTLRRWNPSAGILVASYDQLPEATGFYRDPQLLAWTTDSRRLWIALTNNIVPLNVESGTFGPRRIFPTATALASSERPPTASGCSRGMVTWVERSSAAETLRTAACSANTWAGPRSGIPTAAASWVGRRTTARSGSTWRRTAG